MAKILTKIQGTTSNMMMERDHPNESTSLEWAVDSPKHLYKKLKKV